MDVLRIGTRRSPLALTQARLVADAISARTGRRAELVPIVTTGDMDQQTPLQLLGGTGVFVSALREALARDVIDVAVHSYKDLPTAPVPGLAVAAVPEREDPRDALVAQNVRSLAQLPSSARIGTGSPRRAAQIQGLRPDVRVTGLRGNLGTRLGRVTSGDLDAVVLACAGLRRLGRAEMIAEAFDVDLMLPAPAQGALAVETRVDKPDVTAAVATIDQPAVRAAVGSERRVLAMLEAGCSAPVAAFATVTADVITLTGAVFALDGSRQIRTTATGPASDAAAIGDQVARALFDRGAADLLNDTRTTAVESMR